MIYYILLNIFSHFADIDVNIINSNMKFEPEFHLSIEESLKYFALGTFTSGNWMRIETKCNFQLTLEFR